MTVKYTPGAGSNQDIVINFQEGAYNVSRYL